MIKGLCFTVLIASLLSTSCSSELQEGYTSLSPVSQLQPGTQPGFNILKGELRDHQLVLHVKFGAGCKPYHFSGSYEKSKNSDTLKVAYTLHKSPEDHCRKFTIDSVKSVLPKAEKLTVIDINCGAYLLEVK